MREIDRREFLRGAAAAAAPLLAPFAIGHAGGVVSSAPALVGEAGPEFILPNSMHGYFAAIVASVAISEILRTLATAERLP